MEKVSFLSFDKIRKYGYGWLHMFDMSLGIELLGLGRKRGVFLEFGDDDMCYHTVDEIVVTGKKRKMYKKKRPRIHIGLGFFRGKARTKKELFDDMFMVKGHETQHYLSTVDKDWESVLKVCFRTACQKLAKDVLGRPGFRLPADIEDPAYDKFFKDLADKGVFFNAKMLMDMIHFIINSLEDGRIEMIREKKHPGFGVYRKLFRTRLWLEADLREEKDFIENAADLSPADRYRIVMNQLYFLATTGWYQKGFLAAYGESDLVDEVKGIIPNISRAVMSRTCKGCMEEGRLIFEKYLDTIIDICTVEADAAALAAAIAKLLQDLMMGEGDNASYSATSMNEEQGDGMPGSSLFGSTALEIEVDKETFDKIKKEAEENGESMSGMSVKVKLKGEDTEEGEKGNSGKGSGSGSGSSGKDANKKSKDKGDDAEAEGSGENGEKPGSSEEKSDGSGNKPGTDGSKPGDGDSEGNTPKPDSRGIEQSALDGNLPPDSKGHNNYSEGAEELDISEAELEERVRVLQEQAAAEKKPDFDLAESDAKTDSEFKAAAAKLTPVQPKKVDIKPVNEHYKGKVKFSETTRVYTPNIRLPFDLEDKGRSLDRKIEDIIKSKQIPNRRYLKSGALDARRIPDLLMGDIDIFKRKGEKVKPEVAAYVLIDNSGSMGNGEGSTRYACCNAAAVLEEGFKRHAALKIAAFDAAGSNAVMHEVIKEFDEVCQANLSYNFKLQGRGGGGNKDGYSIRVATQQLLQRQERNKILIIASDGLPSDYEGGFGVGISDVKAAVEEARKAGIRTVGMYMYHEQCEDDFALFKDMYAPEIIFASLDEIEDTLTRILSQYF